jgi:hypothetical protein
MYSNSSAIHMRIVLMTIRSVTGLVSRMQLSGVTFLWPDRRRLVSIADNVEK